MLAPNAENEVVDDFYRFCDESRRMFPKFAEELLAETGVDIELDRGGTLYAAFTGEDSKHLELRFSRQIEAGIPVERLSREETREAEPCLAEDVRESLFFPNDWQVENRKLLAALKQYAAVNRIALIDNSAVDGLIVDDSRVSGIRLGEERVSAGTIVLATGAWTSLIKIGDAAVPVSVKPIRGQMIGFAPSSRLFNRVIYSPRGYLVPRADGRILAGATVEDVGFDDRTTDGGVRQLKAAALEMAPCLADHPIAESWSGLRPFASDGFPIIGGVPGHENLFVATAHYRNGILLAPITARMLAEKIVVGEHSKYFDLFGPERPIKKELNANA